MIRLPAEHTKVDLASAAIEVRVPSAISNFCTALAASSLLLFWLEQNPLVASFQPMRKANLFRDAMLGVGHELLPFLFGRLRVLARSLLWV